MTARDETVGLRDGVLTVRGIRVVDEAGRERIVMGIVGGDAEIDVRCGDVDGMSAGSIYMGAPEEGSPGVSVNGPDGCGVRRVCTETRADGVTYYPEGIEPGRQTDFERIQALEAEVAELRQFVPVLDGPSSRPTPCPCGFDDPIYGHDWLLGIEERGVAGVVELTERVSATLDGVARDDEQVLTRDLVDFVARHRWNDPNAVHRLAQYVCDHEEMRHAALSANHGTRQGLPA